MSKKAEKSRWRYDPHGVAGLGAKRVRIVFRYPDRILGGVKYTIFLGWHCRGRNMMSVRALRYTTIIGGGRSWAPI